jgi:hypothetical protein
MSNLSILPDSQIACRRLVTYLLIAIHFAAVSAIGQTPGSLKVVDLATDTPMEAIEQAHAGFAAGDTILRVTNGTPEDVQQLIGASLPNADVTTGTPGRATGANGSLANQPKSLLRAAAAHKDKTGGIRSVSVFSPNEPDSVSIERWTQALDAWIDGEQAEELAMSPAASNPEPPQDAWTPLYRTTVISIDGSENKSQLTFAVYRMNSISTDKDFYMVATVPQTAPHFDERCNGAHCGWHTLDRSIKIFQPVTVPSSKPILADHGPTGTIKETTTGFTVGLDLSTDVSAGISASYSESWSTPDVVTTDNSNHADASWSEEFQFSGLPCNPTSAPGTSTGTFLSRQAAIFQVPAATTTIPIHVNFSANYCYYDFLEYGFAGNHHSSSIDVTIPLGPPTLTAFPAKITIPVGKKASIAVNASIPGSTEGFSWMAKSNQLWATIPTEGPFSGGHLIPVTIAPDTKDGLEATISIVTDPKFASPSVRTGPLQIEVTVGTPTQQPAGGVLLTGGVGAGGVENTSQVYDFTSNTIFTPPALNVARSGHTATMLKNGSVLAVGGQTSLRLGFSDVTATAEIYDPASFQWNPTGSLNTARTLHTATRLPDGKVLITGGITTGGAALESAELYDPATGKFTGAGTMLSPRSAHHANLIPGTGSSAKVVVYGGTTASNAANSTEVWDESTLSFTAASSFPSVGLRNAPDAVPFNGNTWEVAGGVLDPTLTSDELRVTLDNPPSFGLGPAELKQPRLANTLTALANGSGLLVTGGSDQLNFTNVLKSAEIRDASGWRLLPSPMIEGRFFHTASLLPNGKVFIAGGRVGINTSPTTTTEFYDPATQGFIAGPGINARADHTATVFSTSITSLAPSPVKPLFGQTVTLSAQVATAFSSPKGTVEFRDGSKVIATATLSEGVASTQYSQFAVGQHSLTAAYSGDDLDGTSTSEPVPLTVTAIESSIAISTSPNPSELGQAVTVQVSVQSQGGVTGIPTGTVTLKDGTTTLDTMNLENGVAAFTTSALTLGPHSITATYSGDGTHAASTSSIISQTVTARETTTSLSASPASSQFGQTITFSSNVVYPIKQLAAGGVVPTGTVAYKDGTTVLGQSPVSNGSASFSTATLNAGRHSITATYSGDTDSASSTSHEVALTVTQAASKTTLQASTNPSTVGEPVTFTAHITVNAGNPTGTVIFSDGTTPIGSAQTVVDGSANLSTSALSAGPHLITAAYSGDQNFLTSSSSAVMLQVNGVATTVGLQSSANPSNLSQRVTFTATITSTLGNASGTVTFEADNKSIGSGKVANGIASISTSFDATGNYSIIARYSGDTNHAASVSPALSQVVNKAETMTGLSVLPRSPSFGEAVNLTASVTSNTSGAITGTIQFKEGTDILGQAQLSNGAATLPISSLKVGSHTVTSVYEGNTTFATSSSSPITFTVTQAPTETNLSPSVNPSISGQAVTFTATVKSQSPGTLTGKVTFSDGSNALGAVAISGQTAAFTTSSLAVGVHNITAAYGDDPNFASSVSTVLQQTVNSAKVATTTAVTGSPNPANVGNSVTFQVKVSPASGTKVPGGTVILKNGAETLATLPLNDATAGFSTSDLTVGTHSITAVYDGNSNFEGSTSPVFTQTIEELGTPIVELTSTPNPSNVGQTVTFQVTVRSQHGPVPNGSITISEDKDGHSINYGNSPLSNGVGVVVTAEIPAGIHFIRATYGGEPGVYKGAASDAVRQVVNNE